ncbi:MAG: M48 family metalloprotease [Neptuniibacter sp.]
MINKSRLFIIFSCLFAFAGCSTPSVKNQTSQQLTLSEIEYQQELQVQRLIEYQERVESIGIPLLKAALPFCPDHHGPYLGFRVDNISAWPQDKQDIAERVLRLDEAVQISYVLSGSPADQAGLKRNDIVVKVNNKSTIAGIGAITDFQQLIEASGTKTLSLEVYRDDQLLPINIEPETICSYPLFVLMHNSINAFADGKNLYITTGLMRFANNDNEIALVLGHEIAHNAMKHNEAKENNRSAAGILDILIAAYGVNTQGLFSSLGSRAFSKGFEREADYVGLYIAARAGVKLNGLHNFWRRMAAESSGANEDSIFRTHPISAERTIAIKTSTDEILNKLKNQQELLPDE